MSNFYAPRKRCSSCGSIIASARARQHNGGAKCRREVKRLAKIGQRWDSVRRAFVALTTADHSSSGDC